MTDHEDSKIHALFDDARQPLSGADFAAGIARELERYERNGRVLAVAQVAALLGLLLPLSLFMEVRLIAWFQSDTLGMMFAQGPWWLAGAIVGLSVLLSPRFARSG